jgi:protein-disulfide isomerase
VAQSRKVQKKTGLNRFYLALGILAAVGIAAIAWVVVRSQKANAAMEPVVVEGAEDPQALVAQAKGLALGNDAAPVKMLVFSDFQCPFCAQFASTMEPALHNEFVKTGKLQFVYYDFPLGGAHKYSFLMARAARCADDQNKFWQYHDLVLGQQADWSFEEDAPLGKIVEYGKAVGLDRGKFESCVKSVQHQDVVSANRRLGERLGVNATPTLFINGKRVPINSVLDIKTLREMINREAGTPAAPAGASTAQ